MALLWEQVVVETDDPAVLGHWWAKALEWVIVDENTEVVEIRPTADALPGILFLASPAPKQAKNRLHLDFRPDDHDAEVARLLSHGAKRIDVGQGDDVPWTVLADPDGNEFCVLGSPQ